MERQPNNNLWAEKLLQVSMPDSGEAWSGMEAILDRQLPQGFRSDRRRWLLLILLLLLLIGVCNCPGRGRLFHGSGAASSRARPVDPANPAGTTPAGAHAPGAPAPASPATPNAPGSGPTALAARHIHPGPVAPATTPAVAPSTPVRTSRPGVAPSPATAPKTPNRTGSTGRHNRPMPPGFVSAKRRSHRPPRVPAAFGDRTETGPEGATTTVKKKTISAGRKQPAGKIVPAASQDTAARQDLPTGPDNATKRNGSGKDSTAGRDTATKKAPILPKPAPRKDSSHKKPPAPPEEPKEKDHGWVFGVGFNQFFPVGGQSGSTYNSNGLTGTLSDYLPVPMIRYYLNHKTYLQVEAQFNTPQPTPKNLVISQPAVDTSTRSGVFTQDSSTASIRQLYYFNIPLSIHFNPWNNLNIGTGLQWSHLTNAIGQFDSSTSTSVNGNIPTVVDAKSTHSFKGDTLYQHIRTNELRFLLDVNYTYKHWVLGLRFNQALSKFVNLQLRTGGTTQATNSSLQLYLRYILWDTRKKKPPLPTK